MKTVTTGEGGAVTTNDDGLAERLRRFRHHGILPTPDRGGWSYEIPEVGFNYRLTDLQAALGTSQLRRLPDFLDSRTVLASRYRERLDHPRVQLPPEAPDGFVHGHHLFAVRVPNRRSVYEHMRSAGIGVQVHYVPITHHSAYAGEAEPADFPETERAYESLLSLPLFPDLTFDDQDRVAEALLTALDKR